MSSAVSVLQRVKQPDGSYIIALPINTVDEVYTNISAGEKLGDTLVNMATVINSNAVTIVDDMTSILVKMAGLVDDDLNLNHVFRTTFKQANQFNITNGTFTPGSINGTQIVFTLANPVQMVECPSQLLIKDIKNMPSGHTLKVEICVNGNDASPTWVDCTQLYLTGRPIALKGAIKQSEKWGLNVRYTCTAPTSMCISDLSIVHV